MIKHVLFAIILFLCTYTLVMAEGDKKRVKNPVFEEGCVTQFPEQIDKDKCDEVPASEQSGMTVFFCDTVMITVCND